MNFGNFFKNITTTDAGSGSDTGSSNSGGLFGGAPGRLFDTINAKTGNIVADFSQKVDLTRKLDTFKKYSSFDKIGQSVLGSTFQQSKTQNESADESSKPQVPPPPPQPSPPPSEQPKPRRQEQEEEERRMPFSREDFNPPDSSANRQKSVNPTEFRNQVEKQLDEWFYKKTEPDEKPTYRDFPNRSEQQQQRQQQQSTVIYEYHPSRGYSTQSQHSEEQAIPQTQETFRKDSLNRSLEQNRVSNTQRTSNNLYEEEEKTPVWSKDYSKQDDEPSFDITVAEIKKQMSKDGFGSDSFDQFSGPRTGRDSTYNWQSQTSDSFSKNDDLFGGKSPYQTDYRLDNIKKADEWGETVKRDSRETSQSRDSFSREDKGFGSSESDNYSFWNTNTTSSFKEPEEKSKKSQFSSQDSQQSSGSHENPFNRGMTFDASRVGKASTSTFKHQNTTPGPKPPRPPPPRSRSGSTSLSVSRQSSMTEESVSKPIETQEKPSQSLLSQNSSSSQQEQEIGYLTRLQCQEIVSAVDDMIADAIDVTEDLVSIKQTEQQRQQATDYSSKPYQEESGDIYGNKRQESYGDRSSYPEKQEEKVAEEEALSSSPNTDDWYATYESQRGRKYEKEEEEDEVEDESGKYASISDEHGSRKTSAPPEDLMKPFITDYIKDMVAGNEYELESKNETFKNYMMTAQGREIFSKALELEGACSGGELEERGLRALLSRVIFILTECQHAEDFVPAKRLLTTSLVFHIQDPQKVGERVFLFSYIKSQPIWHSLRFWNACFFQSVQETRAKLMDQSKSDAEIEKALVEQIKSYLNTMQVFNLHTTMRHEFLRKQGDLFNLPRDGIEYLSTLIENSD